MPRKESLYPADWLCVAEKDLSRVELLLAAGDSAGAAFHLQQGAEKSLKAFLLAHGWALKRIHDVEALLNRALRHDPSLEEYRSVCQQVTTFYGVERYPFIEAELPTQEEVRSALESVRRLFEAAKGAIA